MENNHDNWENRDLRSKEIVSNVLQAHMNKMPNHTFQIYLYKIMRSKLELEIQQQGLKKKTIIMMFRLT